MTDSILGSFAWPFGSQKAEKTSKEIKETSKEIKKEGSNVKFAIEITDEVSYVIEYLLKLHSYKNRSEFRKHVDLNALAYLASLKGKFILLKKKLNAAEKADPSLKDLSILKFCRSVAENDKLHEELSNLVKKCRNVPPATRYERLYPQLNKMVKNFDMHQLQKQISFLKKLKEKNDFNAIRNDCGDKWDFDDLLIDLVGDEKFREEYIDKALDEEGEPFSKSFREDLNSYIDLADEGQEVASKYLGENIEFQAYYAKADDGNSKVLNINLIGNNSRSEPTQISDILQQEENTSELNIYCNKKHEVHAYQKEGKKRHYEFKDGAYYEMTSTWRAEDESGNISICKMIMDLSSNGITKIVEFNGKKPWVHSKKNLALVKQNHELHIQGCSLYDGVEKLLGPECTESIVRIIGKSKEKDIVANSESNSSQEDKTTGANQNPNDKGTDANQDFENNTPEEKNEEKDIVADSEVNNSKKDEANETKQNPNDKGIDANQDFENNITEERNKKKDAVRMPDAVPVVAGNSVQKDKAVQVNHNLDANQDCESSTVPVVCDVLASEATKASQTEIGIQTEVQLQKTVAETQTQTEIYSQQAAAETQTEINIQQIATQTEIHTQQIATQTEVDSSQMDKLANLEWEASKLKKESVELNQAAEAGLQKHNKLIQELKTAQAEKEELNQESSKIIEFNKRVKHVNELLKDHVEKLNGEKCDLQDKIKKIEREFAKERGSMNERITNAQQRVVELSRRDSDLRGGLIKARQTIEKLEQQNSDLQVRGQAANQAIENLEEQNGNLQIKNSDLEGDLIETKQKIKELEQQNSDLQEKDRVTIEKLGENSNLKAENDKISKELAKFKREHEEKAKELEGVCEEKENVEKDLGILSQKNLALNSMLTKLKEELHQAREYAEYLMDEGSKAERGFRSKMLELDQKCKEKLKFSNDELEKKSWAFEELQNEIVVKDNEMLGKKKKFEQAERVYRELEGNYKRLGNALEIAQMENSMQKGILQGAVEIRKDLEKEIEELKAIIANKVQDIAALQEENGRLTEVIKIQDAGLSPLNPTDEQKVNKSSMSTFKEFLTFTVGIGELISLSRSSSVESGLGSGDEDDKWRNKIRGRKNPPAIVQSS